MRRVRIDLIQRFRKYLLTGVLVVLYRLTMCLGGRLTGVLGWYAHWGDPMGEFWLEIASGVSPVPVWKFL